MVLCSDGDLPGCRQFRPESGALALFRGRHALHRVTPVQAAFLEGIGSAGQATIHPSYSPFILFPTPSFLYLHKGSEIFAPKDPMRFFISGFKACCFADELNSQWFQ